MQAITNTAALFAKRQLGANEALVGRSMQRLSSGLRINAARDDAAGLAISQRMRAQINGTSQGIRNAADAVSVIQTAEGAMGKIADTLQRMRQLAVAAANDNLSVQDRKAYQSEVSQLLSHVDTISQTTRFNGEGVFSTGTTSIGGNVNQRAVLDGLRLGWLEEPENLIRQYYGLQADNASLEIDLTFTDGVGNAAASVSGSLGGDGKVYNQKLNIDMADFTPPNLPNGGNAPFYNDRIIAHEMVHAVMGRTMNFGALPTWFLEGAAELIHGADERLAGDIAGSGLGNVVDQVSNAWGSNSIDYSSAYAATRYMHSRIKDLGGTGIKDVMQYLNQNQSADLDAALNAVTGGTYATAADFLTDFDTNGAAFITNVMNLTNADTGAIGGLDADGGSARTATSVLTDVGSTYGDDVLSGFAELFPTIGGYTEKKEYKFQVGAGGAEKITTSFSAVGSSALGIAGVDLSTNPTLAIVHIDQAIDHINLERANMGAVLSRMDSTMRSLEVQRETTEASSSRIVDADYAAETAHLTKALIIQQAGVAMVAQGNDLSRLVISLLRP